MTNECTACSVITRMIIGLVAAMLCVMVATVVLAS